MKTRQSTPSLLRSGHLATRSLSLVIILPFFSPGIRAADEADLQTKQHTLFVGTDFSVPQDGKYYRVVGATKDALQVEVDRKTRKIPLKNAKGIRISRGIKLSSLTALISNLEGKKTTTAQPDTTISQMSLMAMQQDIASNQATDSLNVALQGLANGRMPSVDMLDGAPQIDLSGGPVRATNISNTGDIFWARSPSKQRSNREIVEISFDVSAPLPLTKAYVVVVTNYTIPKKANRLFHQITAWPLDGLDATPQTIKIVQSNFPAGFQPKGCNVGIYASDQEVVTNLSKGQVSVTGDEAYQYFLADYLAAHKDETLPPVPLLMTPASEISRQVDLTQLNPVVFATVDKQGTLLGLRTDESGTGKISSQTEMAVKNFRFIPALDRGQPVEGRVQLNLVELIR